MTDQRYRFVFSQGNIRGIWVELDQTFQDLIQNTSYPKIIQTVLGQACAASCLLAATIKSDGNLTLQIQGDGDVSLLIMQAAADCSVRGMAIWDEDAKLSSESLFAQDGKLVMTLDPGEGKQRYQGITELQDHSLLASLENYLTQSEQLPTRLWLATEPGKKAAGLLLQQLPDADQDYWQHLNILASTITDKELLELPVEQTLTRLFHEESLELFAPDEMRFECSCSDQRVVNMILGLGQDEADSVIEEAGNFEVTCEFCAKTYIYDPIDVKTIFATGKLKQTDDNIH